MILPARLTSGDARSFLLHECLFLLVSFSTTANAAIADGVALRIHPICDSITDGFQSSDGNGYRNALLGKLSGNKVQYIGSSRAGSMSNNANDGYSGFEIDQISARIGPALSQRPNVVLLMAGTNDINNNDNPDGAPGRLGSLLDKIISACPDALIVLAKITPIASGGAQARAQAFNSAMDGVAQARIKDGHKIVVVDMQNSQTGLTASDLIDGLHPTDAGYAKMATVWYNGIASAASNGMITAPKAGASVSGSGQAVCHGKLFWYNNYGTIASGVGSSDPPFKSSWIDMGSVASGIGAGRGVRIADLDGDGLDDYLWVDDKTGAATLYINGGYSDGKINWQPKGQVASGLGDGAGVRFADITGDGLADYIWISKDGDIKAYINNGPKGGDGWNWAPLASITNGLDKAAVSRASIRFADLDGDGRADLSIVGEGGSLTSWIATGRDAELTWLSIGTTAGGIGDAAGVQLYDINGDGRADYIWVDKSSATTAYINLRAKDSLVPNWISAGKIGSGVGTGRANITFGDLTGDGKADFLIIKNSTGAIDMYENKGAGAAYQAGDQVVFADLDGDGLDDYISIGPNGALLAYRNGGANTGANNGWNWISWGTIASGVGKRHKIR
jgi:lysophospholipase L1-like esterase